MGFTLDTSALDRAAAQFKREVERVVATAVAEAAMAGAQEAKDTAKFKDRTGKLRASIQANPTGPMTAEIVADAPYASWVNDGTEPHAIVAHGRALRFEVGGDILFRASVQHPGTQPDGFMERAAAKAEEVLVERIAAGIEQAAKTTLGARASIPRPASSRARDAAGRFIRAA